jgi:hypothetical protein
MHDRRGGGNLACDLSSNLSRSASPASEDGLCSQAMETPDDLDLDELVLDDDEPDVDDEELDLDWEEA